MGAIDDTRKLIQDLVTPDLRALEARVGALEQKMDIKFRHLDGKIDLKFDLVAANAAANHSAIMHALDIDRRIERLESDRDSSKDPDRPS